MKRNLFLVVIVCVTCLSNQRIAANTNFSTYTKVEEGDSYGITNLDPWPLQSVTLDMLGGQIDSLNTWMSSEANLSGGNIDNLYTYESSVVNIGDLAIVGNIGTYSDLFDDSIFSTVNIYGGAIGQLDSYGVSQVHLYVSSFNVIIGSTETNIGYAAGESFWLKDKLDAQYNALYNEDFSLSYGVSMGLGGFWADGNNAGINLATGNEMATIDNIKVHIVPLGDPNPTVVPVPVPGAAILLGIGLLTTGTIKRLRLL